MRRFPCFCLLLCLLLSGVLLAQDQIKPEWKDVIATWGGNATCADQSSGCQDEQVLYRVKPDEKHPDRLTLETFKIENNRPIFTGVLPCEYLADKKTLICPAPKSEELTLTVEDDQTMDGAETIGRDKMVYRNISLKKQPD